MADKKGSFLMINQHTVPVFIDVVNAFSAAGERVALLTGNVEEGANPLSPRVRVVRSIRYDRRTTLTRIATWLLFAGHCLCWLAFVRRPSAIFVVTNPPIAPILTAFIARLRRIPYYVLIYDLYPDALVQAGFVQKEGFIARKFTQWNRLAFRRASVIFTLSDSMARAVKEYCDDEKIVVIPNWADTSYIKPRSTVNSFRSRFGEDKLIVMYSGNMGLTHDLESLLEAASILREERDIVFVLIGDGGKRARLLRMRDELGLDQVHFLPYQGRTQFPETIAAADIGVVTLGTGAEGISVPSKTYVNLAAGLCLLTIAPTNSELVALVSAYSVGVACTPGDAAGVAAAIRQLRDEPATLLRYRKMSARASYSFTPANASRYVQSILNDKMQNWNG